MHSFIQLSLLFIKCYNSQPIDDPLSIESTNHSPFSVENTWSNSNSTLNTFNSSSLKYLNQSTLVTKIIGPPQNQTYTPEWPHVFDSINDLYHAIKHSNETVISSMFSSNYINRKFIGCGANGLVYSFFSISSKKQVAIKFSIGEPLDKELPHEVSVLEFISSISGVPKIYAFGRISGTTIVVMNLIRRQDNVPDFYAWNKIHTMEYFEMIEMFQQLVKIVTKLHSIGVVHCDIKEGNILIDDYEKLTLIDFGNSMIINGQYRYGIDSLTTLEYADPDALAKRYHDLKKNDVWSMGVVLFRMIHKIFPFKIESMTNHTGGKQIKEKGASWRVRSRINLLEQCPFCVELLDMTLEPSSEKRASAKSIHALIRNYLTHGH